MDNLIKRDELKELIDKKGSYVLIDVRQKEELAYGMIPTAHNVPLHEFEDAFKFSPKEFEARYHFAKPSKEDTIIFHCRTGSRSAQATAYMHSKGYTHAKNFRGSVGSVNEWSEIDQNVRMY